MSHDRSVISILCSSEANSCSLGSGLVSSGRSLVFRRDGTRRNGGSWGCGGVAGPRLGRSMRCFTFFINIINVIRS